VPTRLPGGGKLGQGAPFVNEGDDYDSAFFDKRSKFSHYRPQVAILNNLEFDHADIFRDLEDVQRTFRHFLRIIPASGYALINGDDGNIAALLPAEWTQVVRVGTGADNDLIIANFQDAPDGAQFDLLWKGELWAKVSWPMHGLFNARNAAMASLASALASGSEDPKAFDLSALASFGGVRRRQDVLHADEQWTVLEDFAHHPTAVAGAIEALRAAYPNHRMTVCFEPRSNTAATSHFQDEFQLALSAADRVYFGAVHRAERMCPEERLNTSAMADALADSKAFDSNEALLSELQQNLADEDGGLVVFFTNGSFDGLPQKAADECRVSQ